MTSVITKKIVKAVVIVAIAIVLLLAPHLIFAVKEKIAQDRAFEAYAAALVAKDYVRAYALTDSDFQSATPFDEFVRQHKELENELGSLQSIDAQGGEVRRRGFSGPWNGSVEGNLRFQRSTVLLAYSLRQEQGKWLIRGYRRIE